MRCLVRIIVLVTAALFISNAYSQTNSDVLARVSAKPSCPAASGSAELSGPEILISDVMFSGTLQIPGSDQAEIESSIKELTHGKALDRVVDEALERVRAGWQDHGYLNVKVSGYATTLTSSSVTERIALSVRVTEGLQYTLSGINFKQNRAISNNAILRTLFPIKDGEISRRRPIATGLESLRRIYGVNGYINFVAVPEIKFDDVGQTVSLDIDVDEGKQFYIGSINFLGLDEATQEELLKDPLIRVGQVYNGRLYELFTKRHRSIFPECPCRSSEQQRIDTKTGVVALTFDFRPCFSRIE